MRSFKLFFIAVMATSIFWLAGSSQAMAMAGHNHHHGKAASPFDAKGYSLHCILNGHSLDNPCPKMLSVLGKNDRIYAIGAECGGSPFPMTPSLAGFDFPFYQTPTVQVPVSSEIGNVVSRRSILASISRNPATPPPEFL